MENKEFVFFCVSTREFDGSMVDVRKEYITCIQFPNYGALSNRVRQNG